MSVVKVIGIYVGYKDDKFAIRSVRWSLSVSINPSSMYGQKNKWYSSVVVEKNESSLMSSTKSAICQLW